MATKAKPKTTKSTAVKTKTVKTPVKEVDTGNLLSTAMLVRFSSSCWGAKTNDRDVAKEVAERHKNETGMGKFTKLLLKSASREEYRKVAREAYAYHREITLPWDDGVGLLPASLFWKYNERMEQLKREAQKHADAFIKEYSEQWSKGLSEYKKALGSLFNSDDYPEPDRLRSKFGIRIRVSQISNPDDFRVKLSGGGTESIRAQMEEDLKADLQETMREPYRRLYNVILKVSEKLADADSVFRDSLIGNLSELVDLLPAFNIGNDPELTKLIEVVKKELCVPDIAALRKDEKFRATVAKSAADILRGMKGYIG